MKHLLVLTIASFGIFTASNAIKKPPKPFLHPYPIRSILPPATPLVHAALNGNEEVVDALLAQTKRMQNPQDELQALTIAIYKGHLSIVQKLLDFFGDKVTSNDASWVFGVASVCKNEATALAMITELYKHQAFVTQLSQKGKADALKNAEENNYQKVYRALGGVQPEVSCCPIS